MRLFRSLRVRNYRIFTVGRLVSLIGVWGQRVAQDWLVLELSGDSGTALGIVTALQFGPVLVFSLYGGVLADRYPKRLTIGVCTLLMAAQAAALGLLDATGTVTLGLVYALAFALGVVSAIEVPVRQAFVPELVRAEDVPNAVSLNSATFNLARTAGPAVAGLAIAAVGTAPVFLANAVGFAAVLAGLLLMSTDELTPVPRAPRTPGQLREGLVYVRDRPDLLGVVTLVAVVATIGMNFQVVLPLVAKEVFGAGAEGYGLLSALLAAGSLLGALLSARRGAPRLRLLVATAMGFGALEAATGLMPTYATFAALLVPTGLVLLTFTVAANATLQLGAAPEMRGRVMALYVLVFLGGTPLGAPLIGWLSEVAGPRAGLVVGGVGTCLLTAVVALALLRRSALRVVPHVLPHPHLDLEPVGRR